MKAAVTSKAAPEPKDYVIHYDHDWNRISDNQAEAMGHAHPAVQFETYYFGEGDEEMAEFILKAQEGELRIAMTNSIGDGLASGYKFFQ